MYRVFENRYNVAPYNAISAQQGKKRILKAYIIINSTAGFGKTVRRTLRTNIIVNASAQINNSVHRKIKAFIVLNSSVNIVRLSHRLCQSIIDINIIIKFSAITKRYMKPFITINSKAYVSTITRRFNRQGITINTDVYFSKNMHRYISGIGIINSYVSLYPVTTLEALIDVIIPPGGVLIIDSDNCEVTLNGVDITYKHKGDWFDLSRFLLEMIVGYDGNSKSLSGFVTAVERWL